MYIDPTKNCRSSVEAYSAPNEADLATVAVGSVCVRPTVNGRSRSRDALVPPLCKQYQNGSHYCQHEYETGDGDPDGEAPLRDANGIWIIHSLRKKLQKIDINLISLYFI